MPWSNQGSGGPWGGRGGGNGAGGPWGGRGPGGGSSGGGGRGGGPKTPDIEDMIRRGQDRMKNIMPGGFGSPMVISVAVIVALALWLLSGFYRVDPDQVGVETVFGRYNPEAGVTQPGLNWNWPWPVGNVQRPAVTTVNREEIGFQSRGNGEPIDVLGESLMLTGDENIIDVQFTVFWVIRNAGDFLFNVRSQSLTLKNVAESAMREVIGKTGFEFARTQGRASIENDVQDLIQATLDQYGAGITIQNVELQKVDPPSGNTTAARNNRGGSTAGDDDGLSVIDAFRDVQAARADKERSINEAQRYSNQKVEEAEGRAQQIIREAEAFKEEKVAAATGEAERFLSVYREYAKAPKVTRRRIYLETMEDVFRDMDKVLLDTGSTGTGGGLGASPAVPYLSLDELMRQRNRARPSTGSNGGQ